MTKITKRWNLEDEFYILTNFKPKNCNLKGKQFEPLSSSPFIARLTVSVPAAGDPLTQWVIVYVYVYLIYSLFFRFLFFEKQCMWYTDIPLLGIYAFFTLTCLLCQYCAVCLLAGVVCIGELWLIKAILE